MIVRVTRRRRNKRIVILGGGFGDHGWADAAERSTPAPVVMARCSRSRSEATSNGSTPSSPAAADARRPDAPIPIADISPELSGVPVDGFEYRIVKQQFDQAATELSNARSLLAASANELN